MDIAYSYIRPASIAETYVEFRSSQSMRGYDRYVHACMSLVRQCCVLAFSSPSGRQALECECVPLLQSQELPKPNPESPTMYVVAC